MLHSLMYSRAQALAKSLTLNHVLHTRAHWRLSPYPFPFTHTGYTSVWSQQLGHFRKPFRFSFLSQNVCLYSQTKRPLCSCLCLCTVHLILSTPSPTPILSVTSPSGCPSPQAVGAALSNSPMTSFRQVLCLHITAPRVPFQVLHPTTHVHLSSFWQFLTKNRVPRSEVSSHFLIPLHLIFLHHQAFWSYMP